MHLFKLIVLIIAAVCFFLSTFVFSVGGNVGHPGTGRAVRLNLIALGLFAWVLIPLYTEVQK